MPSTAAEFDARATSSGPDATELLVELLASAAALLPVTAVVIRYISFAIDPLIRNADLLAPALPKPLSWVPEFSDLDLLEPIPL